MNTSELSSQSLEDQAHEILHEIWQCEVSDQIDVRECSAYQVIDPLLKLLEQAHEMSADHLEATVRIIVKERSFTEESNDVSHEPVSLEQQVSVLIIVLEQLRQIQIKGGHWSARNNAPIMFG